MRIAAQPQLHVENNEERVNSWANKWLQKQSVSGDAYFLTKPIGSLAGGSLGRRPFPVNAV